MTKVKDILEKKGNNFWAVRPDNTVFEALEKMAEKEIGCVMVVENDTLSGIFSERDYARKIVLHGFASKNSMVGDFMTKDIIYVQPNTDIYSCMALMTSKRVRHLPVLENNKILGVISIGDVVNAVIQQQHITIQDLENYIYGGKM
jgi:signal-transduction protein with cAMP-binding, CBS, and nucleotidyltransferase domain